jgi:hypothetical protein
MKKEIHILMGLPGSGKTTWRKRNESLNGINDISYCSLDCDEYLIEDPELYNYGRYSTIPEVIKHIFNINVDRFMCIDGLITTNKQVKEIISLIHKKVKQNYYDNDNFIIVIHHWKENRENCLYNDKYRRDKSCKTSIMNLPLEDPNGYDFNSDIEVKIEYHDVLKKTIYEGEFEPISIKKDNTLRSQTWCSGGSWGDCWGNSGSCSTEDPVSFVELDNLLERICPNLTFLQYKKIERECVEVETDYNYDYYGGCQHDSYYKCDLKKLYEIMIEMGLITEYV